MYFILFYFPNPVNFGRDQLKCDGTSAETIFRLSAKRTSPFKSAGGRQFSRLLAAEVCASAVVMLDTPCSEVVWRVLATHSIRQFSLHFPSRALPCAITFQLDSTTIIDISNAAFLELCSFVRHDSRRILLPSSVSRAVQDCLSHPSNLEKSARNSDFSAILFFLCFVRVMPELDVGRVELGVLSEYTRFLKTSGVAYKSVRGGRRSTETRRQWTTARRYEAVALHINPVRRTVWTVMVGESTAPTDRNSFAHWMINGPLRRSWYQRHQHGIRGRRMYLFPTPILCCHFKKQIP